jgi:hypothetical protein
MERQAASRRAVARAWVRGVAKASNRENLTDFAPIVEQRG